VKQTTAERLRRYTGSWWLGSPHRLFFASAAVWAMFALTLWMFQASGLSSFVQITPAWHAHEMLWGYFSAVLVGHGLLSVPNQSGKLPVTGSGLLILWGVWVSGRLAMLSPASEVLKGLVDMAFWGLLLFVLFREVATARKLSNGAYVLAVSGFSLANAAFHFGHIAVTPKVAISLIVFVITLIGGRMIYSFTENARVARQRTSGLTATYRPMETRTLQRVVAMLTAGALVAWLLAPSQSYATAALLLAAFTAAMRLGVWFEMAAGKDVFLRGMYAAYFWVFAGLLILATGAERELIALHILMVGGMFTLTVTIMLRSLLRSVGYPKPLQRPVGWLLLSLQIAVAGRVAAVLLPGLRIFLLGLATAATLTAFGGLLLVLVGTRRFSISVAHKA
jgi:uncharacterized protein involved in response to NO